MRRKSDGVGYWHQLTASAFVLFGTADGAVEKVWVSIELLEDSSPWLHLTSRLTGLITIDVREAEQDVARR